MFVKICGLTSRDAVAAAVAAGADAVGFVFAASSREVTPEQARTLAAAVPRATVRVAVFRHPTPGHCARVLEVFEPDWVQTDAEDLTGLSLPPSVRVLPVYRNGRLPAPPEALPARLLFEGVGSGTGTPADWDEARRIAATTEIVLAGGLDAGNVGAAIEHVRPWGVDVSSGVERERGRKDPALINEFVARVRATER
jgi:phosphoribosylanthranilate isomerase